MEDNYLKKELFELVKKDESIFEFIQDNLIDGLWYWDLENPENEWMNARFWTTLGYDPTVMPHKASAWQEIIFKEDLEVAVENLNKHIASPDHPYDQIVRYKHKDGSVVWIHCYGKAIRNTQGKATRMLGAHADITKLKNTEKLQRLKEQAEANEKRWEYALEGAGDGVWDWNLITNEVFFSKQWKAMLGFEEHEIEASLEEWEKRVHPDDLQQCVADIQAHISGETDSYTNSHRVLCKDGSYKWILDRGKVMEFTPDGKPYRMVGTHNDLTETKKREKELTEAKLNAQKYSDELNALNEEYYTINEELYQTNQEYQSINEELRQTNEALLETQQKLQESEKRFKLIVEKSPLAIYQTSDIRQKAEYINQTFTDLFGYTITDVPSASEWWPIAYPDKTYRKQVSEEWNEKVAKAIETKSEIAPMTTQVTCKDGSQKLIKWGFLTSPQHNWAFGLDLTELKKKEQELASINEKLHISQLGLLKAQERAKLGSWYLNIDTNEVTWTDELYRMYGLDPKLPPPPYTEHSKLFTAESWEILSSSLAKTQETGTPYELELKTIRPDKSNGWMWVRGETITNDQNEIIGLWGAAQDITEKKRVEESLINAKQKAEESEQQFRQLFDNMEQGFALHRMIYDHNKNPIDYEFILINKAFEKLTGTNASQLIGKTVKQTMPNVEQIWIDNYGKVAKTGEPLQFDNYSQEFDRYYDVIAYSPKPDYFAVVFTDVTDIKNYEKELIKAKEKAEESDRLKSAFLANMSHEIRTPMNAIIGFASFLKKQNTTHENISKYASIITTNSQHLLSLINDIIDISKIEAGQVKVSKTDIDINVLLRELYNFFHSQLVSYKKFGIYLKMDIPYQKFFVSTDETRLRQILINLLGNSMKFTESGEIEFGYRLTNTNKIEFFVRDTGIGIPAEKQQLIFERFQQAAENTEKFYGGTGLGLSIAKACVQLLNGDIWLKSIPKSGTTFYFTIEYNKGKEPECAQTDENKYQFNSQLILIAEDDNYNYEYFNTILSDYNLRLVRSITGRETIHKALELDDVKLILMDIQMPDLSGIDATIEIRKHKPDLPIIAQTAYAMNSDKEKYLEIGCNAYISKPVDESKLLKLIDTYI